MVTFAEARERIASDWPDYETATYGYESDESWLLVLLPVAAGGRIPAVSKTTGDIQWINENDDEYTQEHPVADVVDLTGRAQIDEEVR